MFFQTGVGKLTPTVVDVELKIAVKAFQIGKLYCKTGNLVGRRQPVIEDQNTLIGRISNVAARVGHGHKNLAQKDVGLQIRAHFNRVVVGHDEL